MRKGEESIKNEREAEQVFLVHLKVSEMSVTVYTSEDYKNDRVDEGSEFADD